MYTTLEEAKEEVWKRWHDAGLRRRVEEYVRELPYGFEQEPRAVLWRWLATPNYESFIFSQLAHEASIKPIYFEFIMDKFCSKNPDKFYLGKLAFFKGKGRNNGNKVSCCHAIDFCTEDGKAFQDVNTLGGSNFVSLHHRMLSHLSPDLDFIDISSYCKTKGGVPKEYYQSMLALFICHGILFENFLDEGDEGRFTRNIVQPAIRTVTEHFGLKPLIVRLLPKESEADPYWCWYPGHLEEEVRRLLAGNQG